MAVKRDQGKNRAKDAFSKKKTPRGIKNSQIIRKGNTFEPEKLTSILFIEENKEMWSDIEKYGTPEDIEEAKEGVKRALLNVKFKIARRKMVEEVKLEGLDKLETEEEILDKAVELVNG